MLIHRDNLCETKKQAEELFSFLTPNISYYRTVRSGTPNDIANGGYWAIQGEYEDELKSALLNRNDIFVRAYHCTRVLDIETIRSQGLLQLNLQSKKDEIVQFIESLTQKCISDEILQQWKNAIEKDRYFITRTTYPGPEFTFGFESARTGTVIRYFYEGSEAVYHLLPYLVYYLKQADETFPFTDEEIWMDIRKAAKPALVICNLPYSELGAPQQEEIRQMLIHAWLYEETSDYPWNSEYGLIANRDIPPDWIIQILEPDLSGEYPTFKEDILL